MTPERWKQISGVFDAALARSSGERDTYLRDACGSDTALRQEIEALLADSLPSYPALDQVAAELAAADSPPAVGTRFGPYELGPLIGEGGMGRVYRARDTELGRDVAIKILRRDITIDGNMLGRFEREARALASLNHPHIAAIYGTTVGAGLRGLVLELVPGSTLADRLKALTARGQQSAGMPREEALRIALQLAGALEAAHEKGIIHRDLKPANVKITPEGTVKVLDFGLAKATTDDLAREEGASADELYPIARSELLTRTESSQCETRVGTVIGTAAYMSPEQAAGLVVDKRADIWAFGCLLYEMLAGRRVFEAATVPETLTELLAKKPDWTALPPDTPPNLRTLLQRCLERDAQRRLRDIGEARVTIEDAFTHPTTDVGGAPARWPRSAVASVVTLVILVLGIAGFWLISPRSSPPTNIGRVAIPTPLDRQPAALRGLALSPDGQYLAYVADADFRVCTRPIASFDITCTKGTEGAYNPFFSPDHQWVAFFQHNQLRKAAIGGGAIDTILDIELAGLHTTGVWTSGQGILFASRGQIWRVSEAGGQPEQLSVVDRAHGEISHQRPQLLKDGRTLVYMVWYGPGWNERDIVAQRIGEEKKRILVKGGGPARYAGDGRLVYTHAGVLMGMKFDESRLEPTEAPVVLLDNIREGPGNADFDLSLSGSLAYVDQSPSALDRLPVRVDRQGVAELLPGLDPGYYQHPRFSPDGRQLAFMVTGPQIGIWIYALDRGVSTRLTTDGSSQYATWSADGQELIYRGTRAGSRDLFRKRAAGTDPEQRLTTDDWSETPWSVSADGSQVAFVRQGAAGKGSDIWMLSLAAGHQARPLVQDGFNNAKPRFSRAGQWLAYVSDQSGRPEIYVQAAAAQGTRWQISSGGGTDPVWSGDGRELFYRQGQRIMSVQMAGSTEFRAGPPRALFEGDYTFTELTTDFDVQPDGQHFVMLRGARPDPPVTHIALLVNWLTELDNRLAKAR